MKLNFTSGTPSRVILQVMGLSMLMSAINLLTFGNTLIDAFKGFGLFIGGIILFILREHVSNSDYFKEFDKHLKAEYEIIPKEEKIEYPEHEGNMYE